MSTSYFITADTIWSPLGETTDDVVKNIINGEKSLKKYTHDNIDEYIASKFEDKIRNNQIENFFEYGVFKIIDRIIEQTSIDITSNSTFVLLASTKGNIDSFKYNSNQQSPLIEIGKSIQKKYNSYYDPIIISNACISGIQIFGAAQFIFNTNDRIENIIILGGDLVSDFVLSGFYSFQALSNEPCKPFDINRRGLNLGEGFAGVLLSKNKQNSFFKLLGVGSSNDANHISGPSRTGDGLALAIQRAINQSNIQLNNIDVICAHGTATKYNDEMEAKALDSLKLNNKYIYGLKGYIGHTLGAAGIIETIIAMHLLQKQLVIKTIGYDNAGTNKPLNVLTSNLIKNQKYLLKTGAGFGGGNAALVIELLSKSND